MRQAPLDAALPVQSSKESLSMPESSSDIHLSPQAARALSMASLVDSRECSVCGKALKGRQEVCSGRCRANRSHHGLDPMALALKARSSHHEINDFQIHPFQTLSAVIKPLQACVLYRTTVLPRIKFTGPSFGWHLVGNHD